MATENDITETITESETSARIATDIYDSLRTIETFDLDEQPGAAAKLEPIAEMANALSTALNELCSCEHIGDAPPPDTRIAEMLPLQPAPITKEAVYDWERVFTANEPWGGWRRTALASMSLSGKELIDATENDLETAVTFAQACIQIGKYADRLKEFAGMMSSASARIMVALCYREDGATLLEQARAWSDTTTEQPEGFPIQ